MTDINSPAIYRDRDFSFFISSRFLSTAAMQVQSVAIGWQIYDIERTPLSLGLVGLCEFVPMFLLTLPAGEIADRFDQRRVLALSQALLGVCSALFLVFSLLYPRDALPYYAVLVLFGAARGFAGPSSQSLLAFLVPPERLAKSIALSSSAFTVAVIAGPALGGFLFALGPVATYSISFLGFMSAAALTTTFGGRRFDRSGLAGVSRLARVIEGIRFVRDRPIVFGAISLDLFAVLLGGAVALLPIFARDILHVGPTGLGLLRSAPAIGAALTAFTLSRYPITRSSGPRMFAAVAIFGLATIVFGLSHNFILSLAALFVTGASDMVSVNVRQSLINFATPDPMRGRVGAVSMLFIGASNELGEFESGITASWFGTIPAVILGGLGTLGIVAIWMWLFPPLRTVDRLTDVEPISGKPA
ncbi:MAG TPA: MFS transporter [Rhizomicrobium sp.]|jgi:MFS family permease